MNTQHVNQTYQYLIARLRAFRRTWRWLIFSAGLLMSVGVLGLVMTASLVSFQLPLPRWVHLGIVLLSMGIGGYTAIRTIIQPLCRKLTDAKVAAYLELVNTEGEEPSQNRILSAVQLWGTLADNQLGYAPEFIGQLILQTRHDMEQLQSKQVFQNEFLKIKRNAALAITAVGILLLTNFLWFPSETFTGNFARIFPALPKTRQEGTIKVYPGNAQIERGTSVTITATVSGIQSTPIALYYRIGNEKENTRETEAWQSLAMHSVERIERSETSDEIFNQFQTTAETPGAEPYEKAGLPRSYIPYRATLENVNRSLQYYIATKDVASPHYQITVRHEPLVKQFQLRLNYPAYTQLPPQKLETNTGDIQTLFGTEVVFTGKSNKPLALAYLAFEESEDVSLVLVNRSLEGEQAEGPVSSTVGRKEAPQIQGTFIAQQSENYRIHLTDVEGFTNRDPVNYTINVVKDTAPEVVILEPTRDSVLDDAMLVELKIEATDDYGIQALQLVYRVETGGAEETRGLCPHRKPAYPAVPYPEKRCLYPRGFVC